jgi:hypothetical protein
MDCETSAYAAMMLERKACLGIAFIAIAGFFCVFAFAESGKLAYVGSHAPVVATIVSRTEVNGRGTKKYTAALIDYWRETPNGAVHCTVPKKLPGWSPDYDAGKTLTIYPRENTCYEPYSVFPTESSPAAIVIAAISFVLIGAMLIRLRKLSAPLS